MNSISWTFSIKLKVPPEVNSNCFCKRFTLIKSKILFSSEIYLWKRNWNGKQFFLKSLFHIGLWIVMKLFRVICHQTKFNFMPEKICLSVYTMQKKREWISHCILYSEKFTFFYIERELQTCRTLYSGF